MTRLELLEEAYLVVPPERIKAHLFEQLRRVALRFADLGVTRMYPMLRAR